MRTRSVRRAAFFLAIAALTAHVLVAGAQPKRGRPKPRPKPAPAAEAGAPAPVSAPALATARDGGAPKAAAKEPAAAKGGATGGDAGRVFRFGEVEVEGRLKSPQIVYFLRRVRAEFAAGDLGHRSFMLELKDTRNDPPF
jgi:hypothetical protein